MPNARKPVFGWMFFDWASQPYATILLTFVFGPYFTSVVMDDPVLAQQYWGWMLAVTGLVIAVLAPVLGSVADASHSRRGWILAFSLFYVVGAAALWFAAPASPYPVLVMFAFGVGLMGAEFATIFTNAILPELGTRQEIGRISGSGWAFGYVGGLLSLATVLLFFAEQESGRTLIGLEPLFGLDAQSREGTRAVGPLTAIWYLLFMIPFFLWVPMRRENPPANEGLAGLAKTIRSLPRHPSLLAYLGSSMFYRDALNGLYAFGGIYAVGVLKWSIVQVGVFGILGLVFGAVFAWLGGHADQRLGPKPVIIVSLLGLILACIAIVTTSREQVFLVGVASGSTLPDTVFLIFGCLIGAMGGALQAASRTMMCRQADEGRMTEAFGLYALSGKATAFLAPFLIAEATRWTGDQRLGVTPLIGLFAVGGILMLWVNSDGRMSTKQVQTW